MTFCLFSAEVYAETPVALVIGNATYVHGTDLKTPLDETTKIANTLKSIGYETTLLHNATREELMIALAHLRLRSEGAKKVVVYFAGHGLHRNGHSHILPTDSDFSMKGLDRSMISVNTIVRAISNKARQKLIFIDACRDNPAYHLTSNTPSVTSKKFNPAGLFILYASQPGAPAYDGTSDYGPFAQSFITHARKRQDVETFAKRVRRDVIRLTDGRQLPWSRSSLVQSASLHE